MLLSDLEKCWLKLCFSIPFFLFSIFSVLHTFTRGVKNENEKYIFNYKEAARNWVSEKPVHTSYRNQCLVTLNAQLDPSEDLDHLLGLLLSATSLQVSPLLPVLALIIVHSVSNYSCVVHKLHNQTAWRNNFVKVLSIINRALSMSWIWIL